MRLIWAIQYSNEANSDSTLLDSNELNLNADHDLVADEAVEEINYNTFSKQDLIIAIKKNTVGLNPMSAYSEAKKIKACFEVIVDSEKSMALDKFLAEGGEEDSFDYKDIDEEEFDKIFKTLKDNNSKHFNELNAQKDSNLKRKNELLDALRELVTGEETNTSIVKLKEIQESWKKTGSVPSEHAKTLSANYSALLDRFYDNRSIFFELKELDRRKNLEIKKDLCEKAEKLVDNTSVNQALKELNELHQEFKNIGPVPKDAQEELWQRFKAASDKIYENKKAYLDSLNQQYEENLAKKNELIAKLEEFSSFNADKLELWNKKADELIVLREAWNKIGFVSKEKSKDINKTFWAIFKQFFNNKRNFYKQIEQIRADNLALKVQLCEQVEKIVEQGDSSEKYADEIKSFQRKWKEIGPVPSKKSNEIFERFKKSCDAFFDQKRQQSNVVEKEYEENLKRKIEICESLESYSGDELLKLQDIMIQWEGIGFVPKKEINTIKTRFSQAIEAHLDKFCKTDEQKNKLKLTYQIALFKDSPDAKNKFQKKEKAVRAKVQELENNISLWRNNLEFFGKSKNAQQLRDEFDVKIVEANKEIAVLKDQLKILKNSH